MMLQALSNLKQTSTIKGFSQIQEPEELYSTPEQFLTAITQKINVQEAVYRSLNVFMLPTNSMEDEFVVVVFEIMSSKLRAYYGGKYLIQMWSKKTKVVQTVHNSKPHNFFVTQQRFIYSLQGYEEECQFLYVANFFQTVLQKVNHPFYSDKNPEGIHDRSVFVDPKQLIVINAAGNEMLWGSLKIENLINSTQNHTINDKQSKTRGPSMQPIEEEIEKTSFIQDQKVEFINVMENCYSEDKPEDIVAIHAVSSEGYMRKEIHVVFETELQIHVFSLTPIKNGNEQSFEVEVTFEFEKKFAEISIKDVIKSITLQNYSDQENLLVILKQTGELVVMSENINRLMIEYLNSIKQAGDEESSSEDEEELARIAALEAKRKKLFYRMTKICRKEEDYVPEKKVKEVLPVVNNQLNNIRNFFKSEMKILPYTVKSYFIRRQTLYFYGNNGEIRRIQINELKNQDAITRAHKINYGLEVTMLMDITLHLNLFNDFLIANTSLIISHQKILSIYNFLNNQWNHMIPSEQGNFDQDSQTYFGMPNDEIDSLLLNNIFTNSIYDCIIMYKGKFIRRLKYYSELDKTYFQKGHIFENQEVLQLQRNVDARNYRQYGDQTIRTLFMIQDKIMQNQQIWVSENGSKLTKMVDQIPLENEWQLVDIPNARSDMLIIYSKQLKNITIYNIPNSKQCLYPAQLQKYISNVIRQIDYDPSSKVQYFLFMDKLYYQKNGNLMVQDLKVKQSQPVEINFNKNIKELYMTHSESVYFKDKNNVFRFAQLEIQKEFDIDKQPNEVFNCRGAFCNKLEYSITTNRIALFTSSFEISVIPLLDRNRIDLMASQDFEQNFICWKVIENKLIALKRPNVLVTWNTDTGKIINYQQIDGFDLTKFNKHTEWNGSCLMKEMKEAKSMAAEEAKNIKRNTLKKKARPSKVYDDDDMSDEDDDPFEKSFEFDEDETAKEKFESEKNPNLHLYNLIEIISPTEIQKHCEFHQEYKPGTFIYVSMPYMLIMDDFCTKMYLLSGGVGYKKMRLMHTFYEQQMKFGRPIYFSPNFHHRIYIDSNTKMIMLNFALTNTNILSLDLRKQILFQIEKTHPMIYFHDNKSIVALTNQGVEKLYEVNYSVQTKRRKGTCELVKISNIYYNDKQFVRRFILDPLNFNSQQASQMESEDILKFRGDVLKRNLHFNAFKTINSDKEIEELQRFYYDKNISNFSHFIINNYRQQLTFSYLSWKVIDELSSKNISLFELAPKFLSELSFTTLPDQRNIYHLLGREYEVLDTFIKYVNNENIEEEVQEDVDISDILFIPNLKGKTPLHESIETNNTRVTDRFVSALQNTQFDHHSRFVLNAYPKLIEQVPQRMSSYLDSRLKIPPWIQDYKRGRIAATQELDFAMTADHLWDPKLHESLESKMFDPTVLEVPLTMEILDLPHLHKYKNDVADDFLEALAETDCIEIFSNSSIQALIEIKWPLVKAAIQKFLFYPYLLFLLCFLYYTVYVFETYNLKKNSEDSTKTDGEATPLVTGLLILQEATTTSSGSDFDYLKDPQFWIEKEMVIVKILVQLFAIYFFLIETRQLYLAGVSKYFASPWNYLDIIPLVLISISISFENLGFKAEYERPLNAVACFFMWIKFLYFWRIFRQTAKFISMIIAIIGDLKVFMLVFLVTLTAFGNALYIMSNNNPICDEECEEKNKDIPEEDRIPGRFIGSIFDSVFFAYKMSLGDFDTSDLGHVQYLLVIITFVVATLFLTIMMLNILIAVISDSYSRVEATSVEEVYKNFADLIAENEYLVRDFKLEEHDKMGDYLYIAKVEKNEDGDGEAWEGKLEEVQKNVTKRTEGIENLLRTAQRNLLSTVQGQSELYVQQLKDASLKSDQRVQQIYLKVDTGAGKKTEKQRKDSFFQEDEQAQSPIQLNQSNFQRKTMKATTLAGQALNTLTGGKSRGLTMKKNSEPLKDFSKFNQ